MFERIKSFFLSMRQDIAEIRTKVNIAFFNHNGESIYDKLDKIEKKLDDISLRFDYISLSKDPSLQIKPRKKYTKKQK